MVSAGRLKQQDRTSELYAESDTRGQCTVPARWDAEVTTAVAPTTATRTVLMHCSPFGALLAAGCAARKITKNQQSSVRENARYDLSLHLEPEGA